MQRYDFSVRFIVSRGTSVSMFPFDVTCHARNYEEAKTAAWNRIHEEQRRLLLHFNTVNTCQFRTELL